MTTATAHRRAGIGAATALAMLLAAIPAGVRVAAQAPSKAQAPAGQPPRVNRDAQIMADFQKRVKDYAALHNKLEGTIPHLPKEATPEQIDQHQRALAGLIERARSHAQVGDVFTKDTRALFRRHLIGVFNAPGGRELKASILDENPGDIRLTVNSRYPDAVPLSTVPTQVLEALPPLPEEIEYRFIGDRLILLDIHAHTIVDFIDGALPH